MTSPVIVAQPGEAIAADGAALALHEWSQQPSPGAPLHVHHHGDEAWYVLEGTLRFTVDGDEFDATAGTAVFVPAGAVHTFSNPGPGAARYLIVMSREIRDLITALHEPGISAADMPEIYRRHGSELLA